MWLVSDTIPEAYTSVLWEFKLSTYILQKTFQILTAFKMLELFVHMEVIHWKHILHATFQSVMNVTDYR